MPGTARALRATVLRRAPRFVVRFLRRLKRGVRYSRYLLRRVARPVTVVEADLVKGFRAVGLREGDAVFVHSALSAFGHVAGGPAAVLAALETVLGPEGLVAMPAFPLVGSADDYLSRDPVFDVRRTPSTMGALTEHFRQSPGVFRSLHPTHSVCAGGPGANILLAGHADAETPFGEGTPFARMIERGLVQIWFGCGLKAFTLYHAFECLRPGGFPIGVFLERRRAARCIGEDGTPRLVSTLVHDPALAQHRIDADRQVEAGMRSALLESGVLKSVRLGSGEILAARMPELMPELERLLLRGITIYESACYPVAA